jgi:xylulose-5-phosphate/fructose-6-phosphate phosphoketolase
MALPFILHAMLTKNARALSWLKKYLRYTDYIGAAQLYLKDNYLLEEPLAAEHVKSRILGHWGTVPGLNFIYAHANYLVHKYKADLLFLTGPGHGAPSILANLFAEGTLGNFYKDYKVSGKGMAKLIHDFSWPHSPFPSHVTPSVPGSILEGGELGYCLATAYGAALDNPDLIALAVIGDGEAETGPTATAWHSNKFLNPVTDGAVLPVVHINGYKISNPTIYGRMSDRELEALFVGYGYMPIIVKGEGRRAMNKKMLKAMEKSYRLIRSNQKEARYAGARPLLKPKWPVILLRTPKGWNGIKDYHGHAVEGSFHSHGVPVGHPKDDEAALGAIEKWLKKYKVHKLVDVDGKPKKSVVKYLPKGRLRIGMNRHAIGGQMLRDLKLPRLERYEVKFKGRGEKQASSMKNAGKFLRDVVRKNGKNFRLFCPDEIESNKLSAVFDVTNRAFQWPLHKNDVNLAPDGRVMEMLSEHTLKGWMMGYILTGRHGVFVSYEAFTTIITSMVDQYAKFLKQAFRIPWRKPVSSAIYINSSVGWRQDHNGYSHQNPSFVSNLLQKHGEFCQIYYPPDANSMVVALDESMRSKDKIITIVAGKRDLPQWLTMKEARKQAKKGIGIWEWVGGKQASKKPDVVLASAGDYMTQEAIYAVRLCKELVPEMKIRYVNVSELTSLCLGDYYPRHCACVTKDQMAKYFTKDKPVVFNYHGYVNDIEHILWPYVDSDRFSIHGYHEEGSTTTPFDIKVLNKVSLYHLAIDMIEQASKKNKKIARKRKALVKELKRRIRRHHKYICERGDDPPEIKALKWGAR